MFFVVWRRQETAVLIGDKGEGEKRSTYRLRVSGSFDILKHVLKSGTSSIG